MRLDTLVRPKKLIYFFTNVFTYNKYIFEDIKLIFIWKNSDKQSSYYSPSARGPIKKKSFCGDCI